MQPVRTNQKQKLIPARLKLLFQGSTGFYCREETIKLQEKGKKKNSQRSEPNWLTDCGSSIYIWSQWDGICCSGGGVHTAVRRGKGWKGYGWRWAAWLDCDTAGEGSVSVAQEDEQKIFLCKFPYFAICWFLKDVFRWSLAGKDQPPLERLPWSRYLDSNCRQNVETSEWRGTRLAS